MAADRSATRVMVVAQPLLAELLGTALGRRRDVEVVATETTADGAREGAARTAPDVVLVDAVDGPGLAVVAAVHRASARTAAVVVLDHVNGGRLAYYLASGCAGLVARSQSVDDVVHALHTAADGGIAIPERLVAGSDNLAMGDAPREPLTDREREVLVLLAEGRSTAEIVDELVLSVHTVRNHVRSILHKLGAHSRLEAVTRASRLGELQRTTA